MLLCTTAGGRAKAGAPPADRFVDSNLPCDQGPLRHQPLLMKSSSMSIKSALCCAVQEVVPKLERPLLTDPETTIPRAIEVLFGSSPSRRYALVQAAFTQDAFYYNTWVRVV